MKQTSLLRPALVSGAILLAAAFTGCATTGPTISSNADPAVQYASYKTYQMLQPHGLAPTRNPAITPALIRGLREEAVAAFNAKGMVKSSDGFSDALILVHGGLQDKMEVQDWGLTYGRFGRGAFNTQEIDTFKEGSLFVDVFDARTRELIWRGSAVAEVDGVPDQAKLKAALDSIIARYPN